MHCYCETALDKIKFREEKKEDLNLLCRLFLRSESAFSNVGSRVNNYVLWSEHSRKSDTYKNKPLSSRLDLQGEKSLGSSGPEFLWQVLTQMARYFCTNKMDPSIQ